MVSAMLAIFILTVVVAALVLATMGETGLSFDQSRSSQVMQLAEAGAYRALSELRWRVAVFLNQEVASAVSISVAQCRLQSWRFIKSLAHPPGVDDWTEENGNNRSVLIVDADWTNGSTIDPIEVRDSNGALMGSFYAKIYVRPTDNNPGGSTVNVCNASLDQYRMYFDSFIVSTATTRNARATVCLKNVGNLINCGAWVTAANPDNPSWDINVPFTRGWQVYITKASYSRWALMTLATSATWLVTGSNFPGPVHSNDRFSIWGNPTFYSTVTQVQNDVNFGSGGLQADDNWCPPAHPGGTDCPVYNGSRMQRGAPPIAAPAADSPFWAVLDQVNVGVPTNAQIRSQTTDLPNGSAAIPDGIYFMDECGNSTCGGIMVQGDVSNMVLCVAGLGSPPCPTGPGVNGLQHIVITIPGGTTKMYVLDPGGVQECTGPPSYTSCINKGKGFNGVIYVARNPLTGLGGNITSSPGNPSTGLFGKLAQSSKITIAADGEITITNMLVYEYVPRPNDPFDPLPTVLGVYAWCAPPGPCSGRNVTIDGSMSPNDVHVYGSILTPWGKFWVEGWDTIADKGTLTFIGGTVQQDFGEFGGFITDSFGNIIGYTGYGRDMIYDARFLGSFAPPFFPLTNTYTADRAKVNPDNLYDRPLWEELVAP